MDSYSRDVFPAALSHGQNYNAFVSEDGYINTIGMSLSACLVYIFTPGFGLQARLKEVSLQGFCRSQSLNMSYSKRLLLRLKTEACKSVFLVFFLKLLDL